MTHATITIDGHTVAITGPDAARMAARLAARLAEPAVEPVARRDDRARGNITWLFGPQIPDGTLLYTSPKAKPVVQHLPADDTEGGAL